MNSVPLPAASTATVYSVPPTLTVRLAVVPACGGLLSWKLKVTPAASSLTLSALTATVVVSVLSPSWIVVLLSAPCTVCSSSNASCVIPVSNPASAMRLPPVRATSTKPPLPLPSGLPILLDTFCARPAAAASKAWVGSWPCRMAACIAATSSLTLLNIGGVEASSSCCAGISVRLFSPNCSVKSGPVMVSSAPFSVMTIAPGETLSPWFRTTFSPLAPNIKACPANTVTVAAVGSCSMFISRCYSY